MSQVVIEMGRATFNGVQVIAAKNTAVEELTSGVASAATTIAASAGDVVTVINNGADTIWVEIGSNPTAVVGSGHLVPPDTIRDFGGLGAGDKVAVINDS